MSFNDGVNISIGKMALCILDLFCKNSAQLYYEEIKVKTLSFGKYKQMDNVLCEWNAHPI